MIMNQVTQSQRKEQNLQVQALTEIPLPITSEPFTIDYWRQ
ncbi:hypothetical protein Q0F98_13630 [Paenibacillus amylolyticus]|nr:hypothetical protein Q0F98_13630 [Paenibacillus amylolyticus]